MATANEELTDAFIRRQMYVIKYATYLANEGFKFIQDTDQRTRETLTFFLSELDGRLLTGRQNKKILARLDEALRGVRNPAWNDLEKFVVEETREFIVANTAATATAIESAVPVALGLSPPPATRLIQIVNSQPFEGRTLKQWVERTAEADVQRILTQAKVGITNGETASQIVRNMLGPNGTVDRTNHNNLKSVMRTVINGVQAQGREQLYAANSDVLKEEIYNATLDSRTTIICASNDAKRFRVNEGPIPPLHFNCRSLRIPYLDPNILGPRAADPTTQRELLDEFTRAQGIDKVSDRDGLPYGTKGSFDDFARRRKRELIGFEPPGTSYNEFLKRQSATFQDEMLGPTRAKIFRQGDISLDRFVSSDGDVLTIEQLQARGFG